jgi:N-acetyl-anhydromuramyl-L-alanine amidase AmpD
MDQTQINRRFASPNFDPIWIPVEFLVLHYTAGSLQDTLDLFMDPDQKVSAHLVIDPAGEIYELVACWEGRCKRAWHAGRSVWMEGKTEWSEFNNFSIGIEIVNRNGNLFPYTDEQYQALKFATDQLRMKYPALDAPQRVLGHEQIARWRGKVDPGLHFDWYRYYSSCYQNLDHPIRQNYCHPDMASSFQYFADAFPTQFMVPAKIWQAVSHVMETCSRLLQQQNNQL